MAFLTSLSMMVPLLSPATSSICPQSIVSVSCSFSSLTVSGEVISVCQFVSCRIDDKYCHYSSTNYSMQRRQWQLKLARLLKTNLLFFVNLLYLNLHYKDLNSHLNQLNTLNIIGFYVKSLFLSEFRYSGSLNFIIN